MRGVVWLVLLFTVAVVAATTLGSNDGLVSIYWSGWRTDLSLNLFVILLVLGCVALAGALQAVQAITSLPGRAQAWRDLRKERAAQAALREALSEHFGARYSRSLKAAARALELQRDNPSLRDDAEFTTLARLLGAASLHRLQDRRRRDEWLAAQPAGSASRADDALRLLTTEWALDDRDLPRARQLLAELPPGLARRTQALRLKLQAARAAGEQLPALHTARLLAKHGAFSELAAQGLLRTLAGEAIDAAHDQEQLRRVWQQFEPEDRRDPLVAARAATRAAALLAALPAGAGQQPEVQAQAEEARQWLRPFWERLDELDGAQRTQLALAFVALVQGLGADWLPRLEAALMAQAHDGAVNAAVGHAFAERQLWGKARKPLETAAQATNLPASLRRRCWRRLVALARIEGDEDRAARCEQAAAALD